MKCPNCKGSGEVYTSEPCKLLSSFNGLAFTKVEVNLDISSVLFNILMKSYLYYGTKFLLEAQVMLIDIGKEQRWQDMYVHFSQVRGCMKKL